MSGETQSTAAGGPVAGWGTAPSFLPPAVAARATRDDAREAVEARHAEAERERQAEERHQRAIALYAQQAELWGEVVTAMQLATGQVSGRSIADILAAASAAADRDDVITAARMHREGHGDPEPLHVEFGEPRILAPAARGSVGQKIASRSRRFTDWQEKRKAAEAARRALESSLDHGLVEGVNPRPREDRDVIFARHQYERACAEIGQRPVSFR
jgi:hypothetical protein